MERRLHIYLWEEDINDQAWTQAFHTLRFLVTYKSKICKKRELLIREYALTDTISKIIFNDNSLIAIKYVFLESIKVFSICL